MAISSQWFLKRQFHINHTIRPFFSFINSSIFSPFNGEWLRTSLVDSGSKEEETVEC